MMRPTNNTGLSEQDILQAVFVLSNIALWNIEKARDRAVNPRGGTNIQDYTPPTEQAGHSLNVLDALMRGGTTRASQGYGQDAIAEDGNAHLRIEKAIRYCGLQWLSRGLVVGEEASDEAWAAAERAPKGSLIIPADPIDGSANYDASGENFSTNFLGFLKTGPQMTVELIFEVTVNSSGCTLASVHLGDYTAVYCRVGRGPLIGPMAGPIADAPRDGYIAAVAMAPHQRARIASLLVSDEDPYWGLPLHRTGGREYVNPAPFVHTMGGAPAAVQLAMFRMSTMLTTEPSTLHDSTGVPSLLALGLTAHDADGFVDRTEIMREFNTLARPYTQGYKPIRALVIGRDREFVRKVAAVVFDPEPKRLIAVPEDPRRGLRLVDGGE